MPSADVFTFITVYYKHGEYYSKKFPTLRQGLQEFLQDYVNGTSHEDGIHRQQLEALPDGELLREIFKLGERNLTYFILRTSFYTIYFFSAGCEQIDEQRGSGLVAVVKGPQIETQSGPCVYLEVYYKQGEWNVSQGRSAYINDAMDQLEREMEKDGMLQDWEDMSEEDQEDLALERSQANVDEQRGWGAVLRVPGVLVARAPM